MGVDYDAPLQVKYWPHPADKVRIEEVNDSVAYAIDIFTDGSKYQNKIGAASVIFKHGAVQKIVKSKLGDVCSNNQAEQFAILKALDNIQDIQVMDEEKIAAVHTDSQITLALLKNTSAHTFLIEEIRKRLRQLKQQHWTINFQWVQGHSGIFGNELADQLAKEAAVDNSKKAEYNKKPKRTIINEIQEEGLKNWQESWENTNKGATCKKFFPSVKRRLKNNIKLNMELTAFITGHGKTKSYLHRFGIINDRICSCLQEEQTVEHLIYNCVKLKQREKMVQLITRESGHWPVTQEQLISKFLRQFITFIKTIDFTKL